LAEMKSSLASVERASAGTYDEACFAKFGFTKVSSILLLSQTHVRPSKFPFEIGSLL
jgi:hypothetical protein